MNETLPQRIQLSRAKGWRMPPNTVKVDRTTEWGNPFRVGYPPDLKLLRRWGWTLRNWDDPCESAQQAVTRFTLCIANDEASIYAVRKALCGKSLACWCKPGEHCHATVLLGIANSKDSA